jgi:hypothetical protein
MKITDIKLDDNNFDMLLFTENEFKMVTGEDLSIKLVEDDDDSNKVNRWINRVGNTIKEMVSEYSFKDLSLYKDELYYDYVKINNIEVIKLVKKAAIEQGAYMLVNGDLTLRSGIGASKRLFRDVDKKRTKYSEKAKDLLIQAGLLGGKL